MSNGMLHFEIYQDAQSEWRWRLYSVNGKILADSGESYVNLKDCEHGVALLKDYAATAEVRTKL